MMIDMAALVLSILGVVLAGLSLAWQVWTWRGSGPRVVVKSHNVFPTFGSRMGDWHVSVEAINRGRAPATIQGWGFELPDGSDFVDLRPPQWATPLPHRLEQSAAASWVMNAAELKHASSGRGIKAGQLRRWVRLADGVKVYSKTRVPITD